MARMIECARARFLYGATRAKMARYYGVSVRTVIRWTNRGSLAKHWWRKFAAAPSADEAFAAWCVFLSLADRRAHVWMNGIFQAASTGDDELYRLRGLHWELNRDALDRACKKRETDSPSLSDHLFAQDAPGKWLALDGWKC